MNMRYICKQYIINTHINMKLRKNILVLVACIATLAMCASCDKDDNDSSANIFTQRIYLDFVTPEGNNLLDANAFADYSKGYKTAQDYFCDDRISILCRRKSDGKTADFIDKGNPTLPYSNFRVSHPALNLVQDMSHYNPTQDDGNKGDANLQGYINWKVGTTISLLIDDFDANVGKKNYTECYEISIASRAIYGDDQLHQLRLYCQVSNSRPVITRVEYDDDPGNLLDHDPYYRIAQQIGYTQFTNNRAYFYIPIIVRRG